MRWQMSGRQRPCSASSGWADRVAEPSKHRRHTGERTQWRSRHGIASYLLVVGVIVKFIDNDQTKLRQ
jgi:hypothetical protein